MTQDKQLKRRARELAAKTGQSYQSALYELDPERAAATADRPPAIFTAQLPDGPSLSWAALIEHLDAAEARLDDPDPYVRAAAFESRARLHIQLYAQTTDAVYAAACARASVCDDMSAARIRFEHGIPTIRPGTEQKLLGLRLCERCGRPWQASTEGACPHCPRLLFGPTPGSRDDARRAVPGRPAVDRPSRSELQEQLAEDISRHQERSRWGTGGTCPHGQEHGGADCAECLAQLVMGTLSLVGDGDAETLQSIQELTPATADHDPQTDPFHVGRLLSRDERIARLRGTFIEHRDDPGVPVLAEEVMVVIAELLGEFNTMTNPGDADTDPWGALAAQLASRIYSRLGI
jgi:hypothetical protein